MRRPIQKFLLLLASSGISTRDIHKILTEIQDLPPDYIADAINYLRREALRSVDDVAMTILESGHIIYPHPERKVSRDIATRIEQLLREEAGLSVKIASKELLNTVHKEHPELEGVIKTINRESFYDWLNKLLRHLNPSELLHHATHIRNKHIHQQGSDWPLR